MLEIKSDNVIDDLTKAAALICNAPVALVSLTDRHGHSVERVINLDLQQRILDVSICEPVLQHPGLLVLSDISKDLRFAENPAVHGKLGLRFLAGTRFESKEGALLGTLCVLDSSPRPNGLTSEQSGILVSLARAVAGCLELQGLNPAVESNDIGFRTLADALPQMIWSTGRDGQNDYRNRRWYQFTGLPLDASLGHGWIESFHPEDRKEVWARWRRSFETGEDYELEARLRHHSGEYRWTLGRAVAIRDQSGQMQRWFGTHTDIDEWKRAKDSLAKSEERYHALVEASAQAFWTATPEGKISQGWGWSEMTGQSDSELSGDGWLDVVHPEDRASTISRFQQSLVSGALLDVEYRIRNTRGEYRWVNGRGVALKGKNGRPREWVGSVSDIHERKQAEEALRTSEESLRLALEAAELGFWDVNLLTGGREWSVEARSIVGAAVDAALDLSVVMERIHPEDRARVASELVTSRPVKGLTRRSEFRIIRIDDGDVRWVAASGRTLFDESGNPTRRIGIVSDITTQKRSDDELNGTLEMLGLALQAGRMVAWEQDIETRHISRSSSALERLGIESNSISEFLAGVHPDDRRHIADFMETADVGISGETEFRYLHPATGKLLWFGIRAEKVSPSRLIGVTFDISERKAVEEEVRHVANHDALTGLPNRAYLQGRLEGALEDASGNGTQVIFLLIDLDNFKEVNDTLGHDAGDALLQETAVRLQGFSRDGTLIARYGGDEFAVLAPLSSSGAAPALADDVVAALSQSFSQNGRVFRSRVSIGIATFPFDGRSATELLKSADIALYRAKAQGGNCAVAYSSELRAVIERRVALREAMRNALLEQSVIPFYQPRVSLVTGKIIGFEALARWKSEDITLSPDQFEGAFDDPELAPEIGRQIITTVASDIRIWLDSGLDFGRVAVNLSSAQFSDPGIAADILGILHEKMIPPERFEVEVTETVLLSQNAESISVALNSFHDSGIAIALDDFGTGYGSLTHLKQFPVSHIKIDRSFVANLERDAGDEAIVAAIINLGRDLGMQVTAEGVETVGQVNRLRKLGCHNGQGYLYSRAIEGGQVPRLLESSGLSEAV